MKKYVFIHSDVLSNEEMFPEETFFEDLTDEQIIEIARTGMDDVCVYDTFEDFLSDFNGVTSPDPNNWYGRAVEFPDDTEKEIKEAIETMHKEIPNLSEFFTDDEVAEVLQRFNSIDLNTVCNKFMDEMFDKPIRRCDCCGKLMIEGWYDENLGYDCSDECAAERRDMSADEFKRYRIFKDEVAEEAERDGKKIDDLTQDEVDGYISHIVDNSCSGYEEWY